MMRSKKLTVDLRRYPSQVSELTVFRSLQYYLYLLLFYSIVFPYEVLLVGVEIMNWLSTIRRRAS